MPEWMASDLHHNELIGELFNHQSVDTVDDCKVVCLALKGAHLSRFAAVSTASHALQAHSPTLCQSTSRGRAGRCLYYNLLTMYSVVPERCQRDSSVVLIYALQIDISPDMPDLPAIRTRAHKLHTVHRRAQIFERALALRTARQMSSRSFSG